MSARPRYSIIVPTYNRASTVEQTLNGCFAQSFDNFEIVVVDDGSSDATLAVLDKITDPRLVVVTQQNAGPAAARNHGMRIARVEFIAFLDSDDIWYADFLKQAEAALANQVSWDESVTFGDNDQFAIDCFRTGIKFNMLEKPLTLYADAISADALSQLPIFDGKSEKYTNFFRWMETQREHMSEQAWHGFRARFESVGMARCAPIKSFKLLLAARKAQAMSTNGMCRQLMQNYAPRLYRRLVDQYVRFRGATLSSFDC